jgi:hypothetical protein
MPESDTVDFLSAEAIDGDARSMITLPVALKAVELAIWSSRSASVRSVDITLATFCGM